MDRAMDYGTVFWISAPEKLATLHRIIHVDAQDNKSVVYIVRWAVWLRSPHRQLRLYSDQDRIASYTSFYLSRVALLFGTLLTSVSLIPSLNSHFIYIALDARAHHFSLAFDPFLSTFLPSR